MNHWKLDGIDFTDAGDWHSFVYLIARRIPNEPSKFYIGQKSFISKKTLPITKSRPKKKKVFVESDWQKYYGSSAQLLLDTGKYGKDAFRRDILHLSRSKSEANYVEAHLQFWGRALLFSGFYNGIINLRLRYNNNLADLDFKDAERRLDFLVNL